MQRGSSVRPCTRGTACRISSTSSASGSPTFTSSMSASGACCATSNSMRDRSPCCSSVWNFLRPVGLMRSPITQNGRPGPITTVLDGDSRTVSNCLPFVAGWDAETRAKPGDAGLLAKADQVQTTHAGNRARLVSELARDVEALRLGIGGPLTALDQRGRHRDAGHLLVHETQCGRRAHEADGRQDCCALDEPGLDCAGHEGAQRREVERDLELQEPRACTDLLPGAVEAVVDGGRSGILDCAEIQ